VEHDLRASDRLAHDRLVIDIALNELRARIDVLTTTGRKVVQHAHGVPFVEQPWRPGSTR
jgi:hypothetical protein